MQPPRPTPEQLRAAHGQTVPDLIAPGLRVLFCGINPSLYSAVVRHHFARPGNRFWPALHGGGFTPRLLAPWEEDELLRLRCGITNVVERATAAAAELSPRQLAEGGERLRERVCRFRPRMLAVLGIGAFRVAFDRARAELGPQPDTVGETGVWVLPNPSGLNAHYQAPELAQLFAELREAVADRG
ncbi:MAG: G/U mismatch-specific DNA glycosylase [Gemmatimonadota bacterium]|jgi:TDG/mug DNA glycosylase family protein|nr:G/U mismatch-specific DNA glycosylase [Gemmatimonadota bacterium]